MDLNAFLDNGPPLIIFALFLAPIALVLLKRRRGREGARPALIGLTVLAVLGGLVLFFVQFMSDGYREQRQLRRDIDTIAWVDSAARGELRGDLRMLKISSDACGRALDGQSVMDLMSYETPEPCRAMQRRWQKIKRTRQR